MRIFSSHTLGPSVPTEHPLNATAYLNIDAEHISSFRTTVQPSSDACFQLNNVPGREAQIISDWSLEHAGHCTQIESTVTRSQSNREALRCGGTVDSHRRCAADKYAQIV